MVRLKLREGVAFGPKYAARALENGKKPSEAYPACTVHYLVKEITDKINGQK